MRQLQRAVFCRTFPGTAYFAGISSAKFKQKVTPGDVLRLETEIIRQKGPLGVGKATATVDGKTVCVAELTFAVG